MNQKYDGIRVIGRPRSGTTWLTRLFADVISAPSGTGYGRDHSAIETEGTDRISPYKVLKSHHFADDLNDSPTEKHMFNTITSDTKIIYIIRDIRSIMTSTYFLNRRINRRYIVSNIICKYIICKCFPNYMQKSIKKFVLNVNGKGYANLHKWGPHIDSWKEFNGNVIFVKYEDLLLDAHREIVKIIKFFGLPDISTSHILKCIDRQSIANKRKSLMKSRSKHKKESLLRLRKGKADEWKNHFDEEMTKYVNERCEDKLLEFGYIKNSHRSAKA